MILTKKSLEIHKISFVKRKLNIKKDGYFANYDL